MPIDIDKILCELSDLPEYNDQIMLQSVPGYPADPFYGIGRIKELNHKEEEFCIPTFPNMIYTNSVIMSLGLYRTRLMKMKPKTCYTYHRDPSQRIHIPLVTNEKCMFIIDDQVYRYPADGNWYQIDTTQWHTAINASWEDRIHIVGCIS
jgi:hypothetical protein